MINYARHDEEFYGIFKLLNGEEVLGKAVLTEDNGETLVFIQNPVCTQIVTKETEEGRTVRGIGFAKWMQFSDAEFFVLKEEDIITIAPVSEEMSHYYTLYQVQESDIEVDQVEAKHVKGYVDKISSFKQKLENIFKL